MTDVDCLAVVSGRLVVVSAGKTVQSLGADGRWSRPHELRGAGDRLHRRVRRSGALAVAREDGEIAIEGGAFDGRAIARPAGCPLRHRDGRLATASLRRQRVGDQRRP